MSSKKIPEKIPENPQWSFLGNLPRDDNNDNFERETMFYMQRMNPTAIPEIAKLKNDISTQEAISKNTKKDVLLAELGENLFNYEALEEHFQNRLKLIAGAIPKLEKRIHDISALRGNDRCDTSVKSVAFYTSGHGELINQNIVDDLLVPTLESAANEYFRDNTTRKELFFKYLLTIKYSSAASPGIEADMIPTSSMRDTYTCDTSSENNNLVSLFGKYNVAQNNSNELFETTRIQLRKTNPAYLKGTTTLDGSIFFNVDPKNLNTGRNEPKIAEFFEKEGKTYSDHYSEYARIQFEQGNIPYQRYIIDKLTPNKIIYFGPNSGERKDMHCFYGLQILKFFNIGSRSTFDNRFNSNPADRSFIDKNKQFILDMFLEKHIVLTENLSNSIDKVFSRNDGASKSKKAEEYGKPLDYASLFDIYIIFFELGIYVDHFDPSCATSLYRDAKLKLLPLRSEVDIMEKYFPQQLLADNDQFLQLVLPSFIPRLDAVISRCVVDNGIGVARPSAAVSTPSAAVSTPSAVVGAATGRRKGGNLTRRSKCKRKRIKRSRSRSKRKRSRRK